LNKVLDLNTSTFQNIKRAKQAIVFTNGCFDLLHPGHLQYLNESKKLADILIVGLNDDESIKRLKGPSRPINNLDFRIKMLSGLSCIDYIVPFSEDTPQKIIELIRPDILVKGDDYKIDDIVGAEFVLSYGGHVQTIPLLEGYSTTTLIEKIKNLEHES